MNRPANVSLAISLGMSVGRASADALLLARLLNKAATDACSLGLDELAATLTEKAQDAEILSGELETARAACR